MMLFMNFNFVNYIREDYLQISVQPTRILCLSMINEVYKFIQNTDGRYVQTYTKTKLHTCIINKHYIKVSLELNSYPNIDLNYITLRHEMQHIIKA